MRFGLHWFRDTDPNPLPSPDPPPRITGAAAFRAPRGARSLRDLRAKSPPQGRLDAAQEKNRLHFRFLRPETPQVELRPQAHPLRSVPSISFWRLAALR